MTVIDQSDRGENVHDPDVPDRKPIIGIIILIIGIVSLDCEGIALRLDPGGKDLIPGRSILGLDLIRGLGVVVGIEGHDLGVDLGKGTIGGMIGGDRGRGPGKEDNRIDRAGPGRSGGLLGLGRDLEAAVVRDVGTKDY